MTRQLQDTTMILTVLDIIGTNISENILMWSWNGRHCERKLRLCEWSNYLLLGCFDKVYLSDLFGWWWGYVRKADGQLGRNYLNVVIIVSALRIVVQSIGLRSIILNQSNRSQTCNSFLWQQNNHAVIV